MKDTIIHCPTEDDWNKVQDRLFEMDYGWDNGKTRYDNWGEYKEESCICVLQEDGWKIKYANKLCFEEEYPNIPIITASEFLGEGSMTATELMYWYLSSGLSNTTMGTTTVELKTNDNFMNKVVKLAKGLALSKGEKTLRKHGLKDECGNYTEAYDEIRRLDANKEFEEKALEYCAQLEAEEKK